MKRICVLSIALLVICAINVQAGPLDIVKAKIGGLGILGACDAPCDEEVPACEPACEDVPACGCALDIAGKLGSLKAKIPAIKLPKLQLPKLGLLGACDAPCAEEVCEDVPACGCALDITGKLGALKAKIPAIKLPKLQLPKLGILGACDAPCEEEVPACEPACDVPACGCAIVGKLGALKAKIPAIKLPKLQLPKLGLLDGCGACAPAADCEVCAPAEVTVEVE